jgi:hypothetical protein
LVIDFDAQGNIVGIDIDRTSQKLDLKTLETVFLPALTARLSRPLLLYLPDLQSSIGNQQCRCPLFFPFSPAPAENTSDSKPG